MQLFEEIPQMVLHRLNDFGAQELSNTAWGASVLLMSDGSFVDALAKRFEDLVSVQRVSMHIGGVEWVDMVSALQVMSGTEARSHVVQALEVEFERRFFTALSRQISELSSPETNHAAAYRTLSYMVDRAELAHFGPVYTKHVLKEAARTYMPSASWISQARQAMQRALLGRVGAGTTERCIVYSGSWISWQDASVVFNDSIYVALPRGPPAPIGESPEDRARALLRHVHRHVLRDNHAERAALLAVMTSAISMTGDGEGNDRLAECNGLTRIFSSQIRASHVLQLRLNSHVSCLGYV